jgi:hypothetical protein
LRYALPGRLQLLFLVSEFALCLVRQCGPWFRANALQIGSRFSYHHFFPAFDPSQAAAAIAAYHQSGVLQDVAAVAAWAPVGGVSVLDAIDP